MDPLLRRLARPPARRSVVIAAVAAAAILVGAVAVAGLGSAGSESAVPAITSVARPAPTSSPLLVQVSGAVRHPGLVAVPAGARVIDAVTAAGGVSTSADAGGVNLAAPVADGQQVLVPRRGAGTATASTAPGTRVSVNTATADQLEQLPRIGPAMAARIVAWRTAHGGFRTIDDLGQVEGIGPKTLAGLRDHVTL